MNESGGGTLSFSNSYDVNNFEVIEVPEDILASFDAGDVLEIIGREDNKAVLITNKRSYALRSVESSNTQLLVKFPNEPAQKKRRVDKENGERKKIPVYGSITRHHALMPIHPSIYSLYDILRQKPYSDEEAEAAAEAGASSVAHTKGFSTRTNELCTAVQASEGEMQNFLRILNAVCIEGSWRLLDRVYENDLIEFVLATVEMNGWSFDSVPVQKCVVEVSQDYPEVMVEHALRCLSSEFDDVVCKLDPTKVCVFKAQLLFHNENQISESTLMESWGKMLPSGITPKKQMLIGYAVEQKTPLGPVWKYLDHLSLPFNAEDRMGALFEIKPKWKLDDLQPYMEHLKGPGKTLEQLVLRHAREVDGFIVPIQ